MSDFNLAEYLGAKVEIDGRGFDPFLQKVSDLANAQGLEGDITLAIAGGVITGTLISRQTYFSLFADQFLGACRMDEESASAFREGLVSWGEADHDDEGNMLPTHFIHLKDAKYVYYHGAIPTNGKGTLWRGRLNSVTGFALGRFN